MSVPCFVRFLLRRLFCTLEIDYRSRSTCLARTHTHQFPCLLFAWKKNTNILKRARCTSTHTINGRQRRSANAVKAAAAAAGGAKEKTTSPSTHKTSQEKWTFASRIAKFDFVVLLHWSIYAHGWLKIEKLLSQTLFIFFFLLFLYIILSISHSLSLSRLRFSARSFTLS